MLYSDVTAYFIILATAVSLNVAGVKDIETAAQAASALRPLAGKLGRASQKRRDRREGRLLSPLWLFEHSQPQVSHNARSPRFFVQIAYVPPFRKSF